MAAAAAEMGGGCFGSEGISHSIKSEICKSILGMRVPRIQNGMVRVPRIRIGDNLAQIKAMRLANVQTFGSNVWRPNINLSAPQIDFSCGADRKMVIFYVYLRNITKKSRFWRRYADKKKIKMVILRVPSSAKENKFNTVLCVSAYLLIF